MSKIRVRARLTVGVTLAVVTMLLTAGPAAAGTFGSTTPGSTCGKPGEGFKFGTVFTLPEPGVPSTFHVYVGEPVTTAQSFVPIVYDTDSSGAPTTLALTGSELTIPAGSPVGWYSAALPATTLARGDYLVGLLAGPASSSVCIAFDVVTEAVSYNVNSASYPVPDPTFGDFLHADQKLSVYIDYSPVPPEITVPGPITAEATGPTGATVSYSATATDNDDGSLAPGCNPASGSTFPFGSTTVDCSATDSDGNSASASFTVTVVDTTAPSLALPANIGVDATGPAGAAVAYSATATDAVDGSIAPTCAPLSGATFAIGDTTVDCSAIDSHGNGASESFTIHVRGAAEQLANLIADVAGIGPDRNLQAILNRALATVHGQRVACVLLRAFIFQVRAQSGRRIPAGQAAQLIAQATQIRNVLGC